MSRIKRFFLYSFIIIIVAILVSISKFAYIYTDYLWFSSLGFTTIFTTTLLSKIVLFFAGAALFFLFAGTNLWLASRFHKSRIPLKIVFLVIGAVSLFVGMYSSSAWLKVLQYLNQAPFNLVEPIFSKDASFYVFSLPFFIFIWSFVNACIIITAIIVAVYYLEQIISSYIRKQSINANTGEARSVGLKHDLSNIKRIGLVHLAVLGSLIFCMVAIRHYLSRFSVMFSEKGIVVGAGYTDVYVFLPALSFLIALALTIAAIFLVWIFYLSKNERLKKKHVVLVMLIVYVAFLLLGKLIIPSIVQSLVVSPNEINLETPFITNNIRFTRIAYGLDDVEENDFEAVHNITADIFENEQETIDNIRTIDYRPLLSTYKQTQEIRLYYELFDVDIDRYMINGKYTQVMLSPRELDQTQITSGAQTWVNTHMVYTHGFGVVMSPVNKVTKQGLPSYLIQDIPPVQTVDDENLKITQPRIYHGEVDNDFILVNTKTDEFDYPKGNSNKYINYDGKGGVLLDSFAKKFFIALRFGDIKILISPEITAESRIMFSRAVKERISKITPFLTLDRDPYMVISEGKLYWIQDAYTTTSNFPYSKNAYGINYIRNPVKIVVDAYNGDVTYYIVDEEDPLMQTFSRIFPGQFARFDDMPDELKKHIRYPEDLFKIQADIYSTYHMDDITVFYNKEDAWQIPYEIYGIGEQVVVEPYYIIMKLPDEQEEEFVLMTTFTPLNKDNMISWLAARCDGENYPKLLLYKFPKDKLIFGPLQIEAKIDQDSEISQQITLWSQQGSSVTRGNMIVIPISNSILYIEPLYIQAEKGKLPELKRVIVSDGVMVVMGETLKDALQKLFEQSGSAESAAATSGISYNQEELIQRASEYYDNMVSSLAEHDWKSFGESFDLLGSMLESLKAPENE